MNPGVAIKENADVFRNLDKNRLKNQPIKNGGQKNPSTSSLFFSQLSSFRGNFSLKAALPFDLPIRQAQEKLNFDQNDSLKALHDKQDEKISTFDSAKKIEEKESTVDKTTAKEKLDNSPKDDENFSKEVASFLVDLKKFLASLNGKEDFSGNLVRKINAFLEKNQQVSFKDHPDLKRFLQNVLEQFSSNSGKTLNIQDASKDIQKNLEGLLQRYQSLKVGGKLLDSPVITSAMVQKEKFDDILNGGNKNGAENISKKSELGLNENLNGRADKALLLKTRHYSQGMQAPLNIGVMSQNRYNAMLQLKGGAQKNGTHFTSSGIKGSQEMGVSHFARGKSQLGFKLGQAEKAWSNLRGGGARLNASGKDMGVLAGANMKNGLFAGGNGVGNSAGEMPLSASQSQRIMDRIVGKVSHHYRAGQETFSLKLQPKELGNVDVWMKKQDGKINLRLTVESHSVKEAVELRLLDIASQLAQDGVELSALDVQVENHNNKKGEEGEFSLKDQSNLDEGKTAEADVGGANILESMQWSLSGALQKFYA